MGHGSYKASDWIKLKNSRGINSSSNASEIFSSNLLNQKYDPKYITMRESCDSEDSPNSTPIILAFDVTGSMGYLAAEIAKNSLNKTILELYDKNPVTNPHVMCAAITSPAEPNGALQVTQFEADIRVVEQLLELKVGFSGNRYSYDSLVWYFAAKHTSIDSFNKRGKKGFLFTIGDEICGAHRGESLLAEEIRAVYGDDYNGGSISLAQVYSMAAEKYEIFHIVVKRESSAESWSDFLPGRVAYVSNIEYLCEAITSIMQITNGMSKDDVIAQWPDQSRNVVCSAVEKIDLSQKTPVGFKAPVNDPPKPTSTQNSTRVNINTPPYKSANTTNMPPKSPTDKSKPTTPLKKKSLIAKLLGK
ncbi:MAG: hypothetical protein IKT46_00535 [Clostridia bacterium]|nr:hypothetical protein [Clostridia bacterium]